VRDELRASLAGGVNARELIALEPLLTEFDGVEIAAAALRLLEREREKRESAPAERAPAAERAAAATPPEARIERPERGERPARSERGERSNRGDRGAPRGASPRGAPSRTPASRGAMSRLFVNAGKSDGMTPRDLVGSIANESGISSDQIGKIELRDTHSIVEISTPVAEQVAEKMNGITVRGKRLTMRVDNDRPASRSERGERGERAPSRPRSDRGERPERGARPYTPRTDRGSSSSRGERSSGPRRDPPRRDAPPRSRRPS